MQIAPDIRSQNLERDDPDKGAPDQAFQILKNIIIVIILHWVNSGVSATKNFPKLSLPFEFPTRENTVFWFSITACQ
jgi:hypothetical protein